MRILTAMAIAFVLCAGSALTAPAPEPHKPAVTAETIAGLLGKDHFSPEMYAFREALKEPPKAIYFKDVKNGFLHSWEPKGISVCFDADCKVVNISLYSGISDDGFQPYKGELPAGLTFADTPQAVKKKLGEPDRILEGVAPSATSVYSYPSKGMYIHFNDVFGAPGPKSRITLVIVFFPKPRVKPAEELGTGTEAAPEGR